MQIEYTKLDFSSMLMWKSVHIGMKIESVGLDFQAYLDSVSSSTAMQWEIECNILDLYPKIDSFGLDLLDTKIVSNLG